MTAISDFSLEKYCPNCLARHRDASSCPHCGYRGEAGRPEYALPLNTVLQGRYLTGRLLQGASNEFNLAYRCIDTRSGVPMVVREYFPRDLSRRLQGTPIAGPSSMREAPSYSYGLKSFIAEARELRGLFDPHLISIRHIFEENGTAYVVEDYCEAQSLASLLDSSLTRLTEDDALALVLPLLDTLNSAHHRQLPHLDLRPENILVKSATEPVLIGFAGARIGLAERTLSLQSLPSSGCMPIERYLSSREMGPWTDVYALAAILYRLLTGRTVPDAAERCETDRLVPPAELNPDCSTRIAAAVNLGLRVNRKDRPQSIGEFRHALLPPTDAAEHVDPFASSSHTGLLRTMRRFISRIATLGFALGAVVYLTILVYVGFTSLVSDRKEPATSGPSSPPQTVSDTTIAQPPAGTRPYPTQKPAAENRSLSPSPSGSTWAKRPDEKDRPQGPREQSTGHGAEWPLPSGAAPSGVTAPAAATRETFELLRKRGEAGSAQDWLRLAEAYEEGAGTAKNVKLAVKWYRMAAEQGLPEAQSALARIYVTGQDGQHHRQEALHWYRQAAKQNYPEAQFALGMLHELGMVAPQDMDEAVRWYRAAAERGDAMAQNRLGKLYDEGQSVPADDQLAVSWYRRAAEQGNSDAQYNLALMYKNGEGVTADDAEALHWLKLATAGGNAGAKQLLQKWENRN